MKKHLPILLCALAALPAAADGPSLSVGGSDPVSPASDGWQGDVLRFDLEEGTATVVKGDDGWSLWLDGASVSADPSAADPTCILFDGGSDGLPLDVFLSGWNRLAAGGVRAQNCAKLSFRGGGALSATLDGSAAEAIAADGDTTVDGATLCIVSSGTAPDVAAVDCGGAFVATGAVVCVYSDSPTGGCITARSSYSRNSAIALLGSQGLRAGTLQAGSSSLGVYAGEEAVVADESVALEDTEAIVLSGGDAIRSARVDVGEGCALSIAAACEPGDEFPLLSREAVSERAGAVAPEAFGDAAEAALADFFDHRAVADVLASHAADAAAAESPAAGIRADDVLFAGGTTAIECRTEADGIVPSASAALTGGTVTVNGMAWVPPVKVSFNANGGAVEPESALVAAGSAVGALPRPTRDGYVFLGWFTAASGGSAVSSSTKATKAATFYAHWANASYKVAFAPNAGTGTMAAQAMSYGTAANLRKNAFARAGYVFLGWSKEKNGALAYKDGASVKNLSATGGTVVLHAKWAKRDYRIAFDANGGKGKMAAQSMVYGTAANLRKNAFSRKKFVFVGWSRTKGGAVAWKNAQSVKNLTENGGTVTLYAKWARQDYKIAFNANGGTGKMSSLSMRWGKSKALPRNAFHRYGHLFKGWALSAKDAAALKVAFRNGQSVSNLATESGTFTLYAVWQRYVPKAGGRIRFALCQTPTRASSSDANIDATFAWARTRLRGDEDVIVFPELAFAPFTQLKTAWKQGPTVWKKAAAFAKERKAFVLVNHPYRASSKAKMYNETRVYAPDGSVFSTYRKRVLARMDSAAGFASGSTEVVAGLPFAKIGNLICKDAFTPSKGIDRYKGADILLVQFAHPGVNNRSAPEAKGFPTSAQSMTDMRNSRNGWKKLGKPYMAVNKSGPDGNYTLCGGTFAANVSNAIVGKVDAAAGVLFVDYPLASNGRIKPVPSRAP